MLLRYVLIINRADGEPTEHRPFFAANFRAALTSASWQMLDYTPYDMAVLLDCCGNVVGHNVLRGRALAV